MRLFRAKDYIAVNTGFIHKGQLFLVSEPIELPKPLNSGDVLASIKANYEELVSPNKMFPLQKLIKIVEIG